MICKTFMFDWKKNPDLYDFDENEYPYLTEKAPEEARKSFEVWKEIQKMKEENPERLY